MPTRELRYSPVKTERRSRRGNRSPGPREARRQRIMVRLVTTSMIREPLTRRENHLTGKKDEGSAVSSLSENDINNIPVNDDIQGTEQSWLASQSPVSSKNYQ